MSSTDDVLQQTAADMKVQKSLFDRLVEARGVATRHTTAFLLHMWVYGGATFTATFVALGYSHVACSPLPPAHLFGLYYVFNAGLAVGALAHANITSRHWCRVGGGATTHRVLAACQAAAVVSLLALFAAASPETPTRFAATCVAFGVLGAATGAAIAAVTARFVVVFREPNFCLVNLLHAFGALTTVAATIFFQSSPTRRCDFVALSPASPATNAPTGTAGGPQIPSLDKFYLNPSLRLDYVYVAIAVLQAPSIYWLLTTQDPPDPDDDTSTATTARRAEYDDIEPSTNTRGPSTANVTSLKVVLLCATIACTANFVLATFPFLVLAQPGATILHYQVFTIFFMWGRMLALIGSDRMAPYGLLGISIIGCGVACCCFVFEQTTLLGSVLFGISLANVLPSLVHYLSQSLSLKEGSILILMSGHALGYALFPLLLTLATSSQSRLFVAFDLLAVLILVLLLVSVLNLHAQLERTQASQSGLNLFISRFLSGESLLKRTRSIRPLISRLRPNSYRRFVNRRNNASVPLPKIEVTYDSVSHSPRSLSPSPKPT